MAKTKENRGIERPLAVSLLAMVMITVSLVLIYIRFQNLRSLPSLNPFIETIRNQGSEFESEEITVNVAFFSDIAKLSVSFIPLALGVGLWRLYEWARAISICLLISVLIPNLLAAARIIADYNASVGTNLLMSVISALGLPVLLHPRIIAIFRNKFE
ncbi:hypothetical protein Syn7502_00006 [Synechococcus sp. PCC 7502]|uniref:hypothetical protein n=1 Tax=Synechococcus sp. PCC 7502 TaxID=1173263 RepID=UPI00029F9577|nr:hypothetical protein [Synechococcus sp. PCC 7502]AFY72181.1 hypothetical protein Syn7502_00006 [Synechococcus sp. PCC 7502]